MEEAEAGDDGVEARLRKVQVLGVLAAEFHPRMRSSRPLEHLLGQVGADDFRAARLGARCHEAGTGGDVEHALARTCLGSVEDDLHARHEDLGIGQRGQVTPRRRDSRESRGVNGPQVSDP